MGTARPGTMMSTLPSLAHRTTPALFEPHVRPPLRVAAEPWPRLTKSWLICEAWLPHLSWLNFAGHYKSVLGRRASACQKRAASSLKFSAPPQRSLRLSGEVFQEHSSQRRRGRRDDAEKN